MKPKYITIHCSASLNSHKTTAESIRRYHMDVNKWSDIGYHGVIETSGDFVVGRPLDKQGAHVKYRNKDNIGICLIGGIDYKGKTTNNFNISQMMTLKDTVTYLAEEYGIPLYNIKGHRDWFGDTNKDGRINKQDWLKECPCFDVKSWVDKHIKV